MTRFLIALILILFLWQVLPPAFNAPDFSFPRLSIVAARLMEDHDVFTYNTLVSIKAICASLLFSIMLGVPLAMAVHCSKVVRGGVEPLVLISQLVPRIALVPLVLVWFGWGIQSKIIIAVLIAFYPIYEGLRSGLETANKDLGFQAKLLGYSRMWRLFWLETPLAMPKFFLGLKTAALFVVVGVVVAEFLASGDGVGLRIVEAMGRGDTPAAFAYVMLISVVGMVVYGVAVAAERLTLQRLRLNK